MVCLGGISVFLLLQFLLVRGYHYQIQTKTGRDIGAATDSDVFIKIYGQNGISKTSKHELESGRNDFESGHLDSFSFNDPVDVGRPEYITIKRTDILFGNWQLEWVRLQYNGQSYLFNYNSWLPSERWVKIESKCKAGFLLGPSDQCIDINECSTLHPCKDNTICQNTPGSFVCECKSGFEYKDRFSCKDKNECFGPNQCDFKTSTCVNEVGNYSCKCNKGFKKISKYQCEDKNECTEGGHTCNHTTSSCENMFGDFYCKCKTGYHQAQSLKLCIKDQCAALARPYKSIVEPARCSQEKANYYGDVCTVRCENGYVLENPNVSTISCGARGIWSVPAPACVAIRCPALAAPDNGRLLPSSCTTDGHRYTGHCSYICDSGYHLNGSPSRECRADKTWTGSKPTCIKEISKPWIRCPMDIMIDLAPGQKEADVSSLWKQPNYFGDVLLVDPPTANANYRFPAGENRITWTTRNAAGSDSCSIQVIVSDKEKPKIVTPCPASPVGVSTTSNSEQVTWKAPTFSDNVGVTKVTSTRNSGDTFTLGSWNVYYTAYDKAGNSATCQFVVIVKVKGCPKIEAPFGGSKKCSDYGQMSYCSVQCPNGHKIYQNPSPYSFWECHNGIWKPSATIPDCVAATPTNNDENCSGNQFKMTITTSKGAEQYCANCPRGMYLSNGKCLPCAAGKYQDQQGSTSCKDCAAGTSSLEGATDVQKCRVVCRPGHYSADGMNPGCQLCPKNTYQNNPKATSCIACPDGTTTISWGMTKPEDCGVKPVISRVTPKTQTLDEGQSASISCYASGVPAPSLRLKFRRNIPPEFLGKETREVLRDSKEKVIGVKLTIDGAKFENTGQYECSAENRFGKAIQVATLTVNQVIGSGGGASFDVDFLG